MLQSVANKKATKTYKRLSCSIFNGRGGEDRTPVDGVGDR